MSKGVLKSFFLFLLLFFSFAYGLDFSSIKEFFSTDHLVELLKEYGYIILFVWSIFEGETGLIMAGVLSHTGDMNLITSIVVAALGGFAGDQIYFYLGRWNKEWVLKELQEHRRKFARARLLLRKYGAWVVFIQRYLYGMRTILPMSIGVVGYDSKKFAIINFISAFVWASLTIIPSYIFGEEILKGLEWLKAHWYFGVVFAVGIFAILWYINKKEEEE